MNKILRDKKIINIINDNNNITLDALEKTDLLINFYHQDLCDININITLKNDNKLVILFSSIVNRDIKCNIHVDVLGNNNIVVIKTRIIGKENLGNFYVNVHVNDNTHENEIYEELKGLNENGMLNLMPILELDTNDVYASHIAMVGTINEEINFYLKSKGLSEFEIRNLMKNNFVKNIYDEEFIENLRKRGLLDE